MTPSPIRVSRLKSLDDTRGELARVYRETRLGTIPLDQAKALAYILSVLSGLIKETDLERRVKALEGATSESYPR